MSGMRLVLALALALWGAAVSAPTALALELADVAELPLACLGPGGAIARL